MFGLMKGSKGSAGQGWVELRNAVMRLDGGVFENLWVSGTMGKPALVYSCKLSMMPRCVDMTALTTDACLLH